METFECICSRRTCKEFEDKGLEREKLGKILEAARHAPSPGNIQSWEFIVVEDPEKKERLSEMVSDPRMEKAPATIVVCSNHEKVAREFGEKGLDLYSIQETSACIQNILLETHNQDLGAYWTGNFDEDEMRDLLKLPHKVRPLAAIAVGYPKKLEKPEKKYKITELTYLDKYGNRISPAYDKFEWEGLMKYAEKVRKHFKS